MALGPEAVAPPGCLVRCPAELIEVLFYCDRIYEKEKPYFLENRRDLQSATTTDRPLTESVDVKRCDADDCARDCVEDGPATDGMQTSARRETARMMAGDARAGSDSIAVQFQSKIHK